MDEEQGSEGQPDEDHLHPKDGMNWIEAINHDEFTDIPCGEGEDKACKEPMRNVFGVTGEDDQTEGEVHRKRKGSRERQDVHRSTFPFTVMRIALGA